MSVSEIMEQIRSLSSEGKQEVLERLWTEFGDELEAFDPDLTPEQFAELQRRAEELIAHPERGIPWERVQSEMKQKYGLK